MLQIAFWLLVGLLFVWLLFNYLSKIIDALWEIVAIFIDSRPVDLRSKFGEWAGKN